MTKRLFISHSWSYSERYNSMVNLLNSKLFFQWTNYSIPEERAFTLRSKETMKEELRQQIRPVNCVIIISGMWFNHSEWIQFELDYASVLGKPILAVRPRSARMMPYAITDKADKIVNWNTDSIVAGIREIS